MKINTPINMKQYRPFVLLCALFVFALSPLLATAQNKEVRMELMPKTICLGFKLTKCAYFRTFASATGTSSMAFKRETGEKPVQSGCCELPLAA